ncbi:MAG: HEAT repeat domain-containing protein [Pyrinomonadaceae bacterium]
MLDLPAPAPPSETDEKSSKSKERKEEFYSDENVPPDDAPIEDLLDYWAKQSEGHSRLTYQLKPSAATVERILEACEEDPKKILNYLTVLPSDSTTAGIVKRIYEGQLQDKEIEPYARTRVKEWLKYNSNSYVDELIREAQKIKDRDNYVQNTHQDVLLALAKVDWDSARPIVERLENDLSQPYSQILARWIQYKHAVDTDDSGAAEKYRRMLQDIVENKSAAWAQRDLAMDALAVSGDWQGRDEWYVSLLEDETLLTIQDNGNTGLTTLIAASPPKKWTEKMLELVKSNNLAVRSAAVRNLMNSSDRERKDVLEALLPWLTNANWAKPSRNSERGQFISALAEGDLPESVPGLISIVMNEEEFRTTAIGALIKYKDVRAIPALKFALSLEENLEAQSIIVQALIASGGFSDDEQMTALEAYATLVSTPAGLEQFNSYQYQEYYEGGEDEDRGKPAQKSLPLQIVIGKIVGEQEEPADGLVVLAVERVKILRRTKPLVAETLTEIMQKWKGRAIYLEILRQIRDGEADAETILSILAKRKDVREKVSGELAMLRGASGTARGIGACLIEDENDFLSILGQTAAIEAKTAMLACARLLRVKLPVTEVGTFLNNPNKLLALAAERWLESEDSVPARKLVLAKHPNEAVILGARQAFVPDGKTFESKYLDAVFESVNGMPFWSLPFSELKKNEEKLREEIKTNPDLSAVYAILPEAKSGQQIIRVYKDKIVFTFEEDTARYLEKTLPAKEFESFYNFLIDNKIDSLPPFNDFCEECESNEFVMFGRGGGRRIFLRSANDEKKIVSKLFEYFESFKKENLKLNYRLSDKIKGLEVLLADENWTARAVWKKDADLRVLVEDKIEQTRIEKDLTEFQQNIFNNVQNEDEEDTEQRRARYQTFLKKRAEMMFAHLSWRNLQNGKPGAVAAQPSEIPFLSKNAQHFPDSPVNNSIPDWQVRAGNIEIRTGEPYEGGLYKIVNSSNPVKFKEGLYLNPIITADGKWAIVTKAETNWNEPKVVVRVNLQTGREYKINVPPSDAFYPIAFVGSHNKVLLYRGKGSFMRSGDTTAETAEGEHAEEMWTPPRRANAKPNPSPKTAEYYLFDAATGTAQIIKGEFRPLIQQSVRPLQPTGNPGEFWAAIFDAKTKETSVGRYNEETFVVQPLAKIPDINLSSMDVWVDEKEAKIYFVYLGHLLALPLSN